MQLSSWFRKLRDIVMDVVLVLVLVLVRVLWFSICECIKIFIKDNVRFDRQICAPHGGEYER